MVSTKQIISQRQESAEAGDVDLGPVPEAAEAGKGAAEATAALKSDRPALDPTRYGDWEKNGRCIDF